MVKAWKFEPRVQRPKTESQPTKPCFCLGALFIGVIYRENVGMGEERRKQEIYLWLRDLQKLIHLRNCTT